MEKFLMGSRDGAHWLDIVNPRPDELHAIANEYGLQSSLIQDSLDPEHLPKFEVIENTDFFILRSYDEECSLEADTTQELTRKVAIFRSKNLLITIHRKDQTWIRNLRTGCQGIEAKTHFIDLVFFKIFQASLATYKVPIELAQDQFEELEMSIFEVQGAKHFELKEGYYLKRRAYIFKRMIRSSLDIFQHLNFGSAMSKSQIQKLKEMADRFLFETEGVLEGVNSLLNLHISLASQRTNEESRNTNEVMRVLTIFSMFLLPLNVITGIYGMNFEHMPELKSEFGYPLALGSMCMISFLIYVWFQKKGWLKEKKPESLS